ncbi:MAG: epoxyqueuosine reductase QueH [Spirochaetia bacterium]|nr:epoxyqueuosine reductase QueH [Spirochaetia bacterium]
MSQENNHGKDARQQKKSLKGSLKKGTTPPVEEGTQILLHTCCGPCGSASIERLKHLGYSVTLFFSNSNIFPESEYKKRADYAVKLARYFEVPIIIDSWDHAEWLQAVKGFEKEPEGGKRCELCFAFNLKRTILKAREIGISKFSTTLTISPHKNSEKIFSLAESLEKLLSEGTNQNFTEGMFAADKGPADIDKNTLARIHFIPENFKKKEGYKRSIELSRELELYRQNYCGCEFSMVQAKQRNHNRSQ